MLRVWVKVSKKERPSFSDDSTEMRNGPNWTDAKEKRYVSGVKFFVGRSMPDRSAVTMIESDRKQALQRSHPPVLIGPALAQTSNGKMILLAILLEEAYECWYRPAH